MDHAIKAPESVKALLTVIIESFQATLGKNLVGIYLHGSLAMGCFNAESSDIDFLVVVAEPLGIATKQKITNQLTALSQDAPAKGLEMSVVTRQYTQHFIYPTPYELHFSNYWLKQYQSGAIDLANPGTDPDLAAHFAVTVARGVVLYGKPIKDTFGDIPIQYYLDSVRGDARDAIEHIKDAPVYGVLNLCRVWALQQEKRVTSKEEGALWAMDKLETPYQSVVQQALNEYRGIRKKEWDTSLLQGFGQYMSAKLQL